MILLPSIFSFFFFLFFFFFFLSLTSQDEQSNNHNLLILELRDSKLKISRLESVLEERIQNLNAKTLSVKEHGKSLEDMANKSTYLQSALFDLKLNALEEEVHGLWAVSRKNNFDLHVLELKAQDAEDRLEAMAEVVTEQWVQIQHLEQALQIAKMRALQAQKQRNMRCTFLKFIDGISGRHLPKPFKALDSYSLGKGPIIRYYEMQRNELTAAFVNDELVFFLASAFITFPILGSWMLLLT
ncbi:hypothetical protein ES319_D05G166800v1 [Gossypium barbadense]|uniref:Uncharacterized protein n=1 Tax=Gossypium barbadense TaxID=3634 RepID=A0A5J5RL12_GOSBA|nr:hypothetical protein ES319_D05G166800v1 [Gossypium barbadense]